MNILGIYGKTGSGKNTTATFLKERYGFVVIHFADALHREAHSVHRFCTIASGDCSGGGIRAKSDNRTMASVLASFLSSIPAHGMRGKGGNCLQWWHIIRRNRLKKDCRVERVKTLLANLEAKGVRNIVIADTRFASEANFIKNIGGKLMRIVRYDSNGDQYIDPHSDPDHEAETDLDTYQEFDAILINMYDHYCPVIS